MAKSRTSIGPHLATLVQNVVFAAFKKRIDNYTKAVKAHEASLLPLLFDAEAQEIYKTKPSVAATMHMADFCIEYRWCNVWEGDVEQIKNLSKPWGGTRHFMSFRLPAKLDRCATEKLRFNGVVPNQYTGCNVEADTAALKLAQANHYQRVGPLRANSILVYPQTARPKERRAEDVVVDDSYHTDAFKYLLEGLDIFNAQAALSKELLVAFKQRGTVERFLEDFPELEKHVPHIPSPVRALVTPSSSIIEKLATAGLALTE